jgi:hypothetical protein
VTCSFKISLISVIAGPFHGQLTSDFRIKQALSLAV